MNSDNPGRNRYQGRLYILHSRPYQNTSMILDVFTRDHGRLNLLAKGARREKSPFYSNLQQFRQLLATWGGRAELKTLYTAESLNHTTGLRGGALYLGFYMNELLVNLLHREEAHSELYDIYTRTLSELKSGGDHEVILRYFELDLIEALGYGINLFTDCISDEDIENKTAYQFDPERGFTVNLTSGTDRLIVSGESILAMAGRSIASEKQKKESKRILRLMLEHYLDGRPLKTRELMQHRALLQE